MNLHRVDLLTERRFYSAASSAPLFGSITPLSPFSGQHAVGLRPKNRNLQTRPHCLRATGSDNTVAKRLCPSGSSTISLSNRLKVPPWHRESKSGDRNSLNSMFQNQKRTSIIVLADTDQSIPAFA